MKIGIVIVTFNRLSDLKKTLLKFDKQTILPSYIVVVNNNSTDGTKEFLENWHKENKDYEKYVINLNRNIGGSGGFYYGLKRCINLDADWIYVSDDDAFPENNVIEEIEKALLFIKKSHLNVSAICSSVINNGKYDLYHRRKLSKGKIKIKEEVIEENEYNKQYFELNLFSYVGVVINKNKLIDVGLTQKDFFIYYDDTEHSYRLSKKGKVLCFPSIRVHHNFVGNIERYNWKTYYGDRNQFIFYNENFGIRYCNYLYLEKLLLCIKQLIKYKDINRYFILKTAFYDFKGNKLGIHRLYKPGWKGRENNK